MGKWVKMEIKKFIREFLSGDTVERLTDYRKDVNPFKDMPAEGTSEEEAYGSFVETLNESGLMEGYRAAVTANKTYRDDKSRQKPVVGLFREEDVPESGRPTWHDQVLHFDFKRTSIEDDLLDDEEEADFEHVSKQREEITSRTAEVFQAQQRCFIFSVGIYGHRARLFRWDRSGVIATNSFDYSRTRHLCDFFYQLSQLSLEEQGYDPTATPIAKGSAEADFMWEMAKARDEKCSHVRQYFQDSLDEDWPWWKIVVDGPVSNSSRGSSRHTRRNETREYLIGKPRFMTARVVGRGTRGYVALDCDSQQFVWLKDAWRVDQEGIRQEGYILQLLNDLETKNVPTVLHHGDVRNQSTVSPKYDPQLGPSSSSQKKNGSRKKKARESTRKAPKPLKWHKHYRLVVKEVCRPMSDFRSGRELLSLLWHCLAAHKDVMDNAGLLHCDLSSGNLMLYEYEQDDKIYRDGMLCDWELSKVLSKRDADDEEDSEQCDRTGTWQFMSVHALNNVSWPITTQDELESFFYVLLWFAIRYLRHNISDVREFMQYYFNEGRPADGDWKSGAQKQASMDAGVITDGEIQLKFKVDDADSDGSHPLNGIVENMLTWFRAYYSVVRHSTNAQVKNDICDRSAPQRTPRSTDHDAQKTAASSRRLVVFDDHTAEALAKQREEVERKRLAQDQKAAQNLASHKAILDLWGSAIIMRPWPNEDKKPDEVDKNYHAGEKNEGRGRLEYPAIIQGAAASALDAPRHLTPTSADKGNMKHPADPESAADPEEDAPRRHTRSRRRTGRSKCPATGKGADVEENATGLRAWVNAGTCGSKRSASELMGEDAPRRKRTRRA